MRVVVLEDYLNYAAHAPCMQSLKERGEVIVYDKPARSERFDKDERKISSNFVARPVHPGALEGRRSMFSTVCRGTTIRLCGTWVEPQGYL